MADRNSGRSGGGSGGRGKKPEKLSIKVVLPPCRMSFPHLLEPTETDNGLKYQANFLFPPKTDFRKFEDALDEVMTDFFGHRDDWPRGRNDRGPDEVIRKATEKDYEGYKEGWHFIKASSKDPVGIVDANREEVTNPRDIYGGRWCRISVTVAAYDNKSKGVGVYLNSVQVLDHDTPFGGRGPAKNDFEDWDGDALSDDDRGNGTGHARDRDDRDDRDDDRGSRRGSRDDDRRDARGSRDRDDDRRQDDRGSSRRSRDDDDRDARGGRDRDDRRSSRDDRDDRSRDRDDDRRGSRDRDDDRGSSRGRDRDDDRSRDRDRDDRSDRGGRSRDRDDDDRGRDRGRSRDDREASDDRRGSRDRDDRPSRDRDDDRRPSRSRDDDDRGSRRGRDDDGWN